MTMTLAALRMASPGSGTTCKRGAKVCERPNGAAGRAHPSTHPEPEGRIGVQRIKANVAVVEDDDSLRNSLARLLRASGHQPVTYADAETFLADDERPRFDCLIVDIQLGGLSGVELIRCLADAGSTTPLIVMTAQDEPEARARAMAYGCAAFLRKSDPGERMLEAISHALGAAK